jgi:hypothetical protein
VPSWSALSRKFPSGLNAILFTADESACSGGPMACPVAGFQKRTVPSLSALVSSFPSGLNATPFTPPPRMSPSATAVTSTLMGALTDLPVAGFHKRTVPSPSALASSLSSGLNAMPITPLSSKELLVSASRGHRRPGR